MDFYDIKGMAEVLMEGLEARPSGYPHLEPGRQADLVSSKGVIATIGAVHPDLRALIDMPDDVFVLEALVEPILERRWKGLKEIPKFPFTWRDLSLVADEEVTYAQVVSLIESMGIKEIRNLAAVDLYKGEKLPRGKKGLTVRITYQSMDRTLEEPEISAWQERVVEGLKKGLGITLRV